MLRLKYTMAGHGLFQMYHRNMPLISFLSTKSNHEILEIPAAYIVELKILTCGA